MRVVKYVLNISKCREELITKASHVHLEVKVEWSKYGPTGPVRCPVLFGIQHKILNQVLVT